MCRSAIAELRVFACLLCSEFVSYRILRVGGFCEIQVHVFCLLWTKINGKRCEKYTLHMNMGTTETSAMLFWRICYTKCRSQSCSVFCFILVSVFPRNQYQSNTNLANNIALGLFLPLSIVSALILARLVYVKSNMQPGAYDSPEETCVLVFSFWSWCWVDAFPVCQSAGLLRWFAVKFLSYTKTHSTGESAAPFRLILTTKRMSKKSLPRTSNLH